MSRNNTLIGFDFERGDKLTILRECAIDLSKQKREFVAVVLVSLIIDYFSADSNSPMPEITAEDPLVVKLFGDLKKVDENVRDIIIGQMNGALSRYIEHQRVNARDEFVRRVGNAINGWKKNHPGEDVPKEYLELIGAFERATKTNVTDLVDRANAHAKGANATDKNKREISSSDKLESLSISKNVCPSGVANVAPPGGGTFARTATNKEGKTFNECKLAEDPIGYMIRFADYCADIHTSAEALLPDDKAKMIFRRTLESRSKQLGHDVFVSCCFDFIGAYCEASQWFGDDGDKTYGDRILVSIMGQLKDRAIGLGVATK